MLPGGGLGGRGRAVHGDWSGEVNQTAGATETSSGGPRERDVSVLEIKKTKKGLFPEKLHLSPHDDATERHKRKRPPPFTSSLCVLLLQEVNRHLIGAVRVGDSRKRLQGRSDGVGQDEGAGRRTVLLRLTEETNTFRELGN